MIHNPLFWLAACTLWGFCIVAITAFFHGATKGDQNDDRR